MTTYVLINKATAIQSAPASGQAPVGSQIVNLTAGQGTTNPQQQAFQVVVTTSSGNGSATVQPMVSNDGVNFIAYGAALVVVAAASPAQISGSGNVPWQFFTAYVTAISGTGAAVTCTMAA